MEDKYQNISHLRVTYPRATAKRHRARSTPALVTHLVRTERCTKFSRQLYASLCGCVHSEATSTGLSSYHYSSTDSSRRPALPFNRCCFSHGSPLFLAFSQRRMYVDIKEGHYNGSDDDDNGSFNRDICGRSAKSRTFPPRTLRGGRHGLACLQSLFQSSKKAS